MPSTKKKLENKLNFERTLGYRPQDIKLTLNNAFGHKKSEKLIVEDVSKVEDRRKEEKKKAEERQKKSKIDMAKTVERLYATAQSGFKQP